MDNNDRILKCCLPAVIGYLALGVCPNMHSGRPVKISTTKDVFFYQESCLVTVLAVSLDIVMYAHLQLRGLGLTAS